MRVWFISINDDGQLSLTNNDDDHDTAQIITSFDQLRNIVGNEILMCSSTLDFPDEYTESKEVIDLCDLIRG